MTSLDVITLLLLIFETCQLHWVLSILLDDPQKIHRRSIRTVEEEKPGGECS